MYRKIGSLSTLILLGLIFGSATEVFGAPPACEVVDLKDVSADAKKIDTGLITATQSSWSKSFSAGQAAWVILENGNVHVTPVVVRFTESVVDPKTGNPATRVACESLVTVVPKVTVVIKHSVFGEKISYNLEVTLPDEPPIDSALIRITIKALL